MNGNHQAQILIWSVLAVELQKNHIRMYIIFPTNKSYLSKQEYQNDENWSKSLCYSACKINQVQINLPVCFIEANHFTMHTMLVVLSYFW